MKKNTIKLNESQLRNIVAESVKKVLKEAYGEKVEPDRETIEKVAELIDFLNNNKRGYRIEENRSVEELRKILVKWLYKYCPWAEESAGEMPSYINN